MLTSLEWLTLVIIFKKYLPYKGIFKRINDEIILLNYE
jgi:hypothetical protein